MHDCTLHNQHIKSSAIFKRWHSQGLVSYKRGRSTSCNISPALESSPAKKRIITSRVLALTTGLHQSHSPVFIFRSSRPLRDPLLQHTAHAPPVNNSYVVSLQQRVREQTATTTNHCQRVHHRTNHAPQNYEAAKYTAQGHPTSHNCEVSSYVYCVFCMR